MESGQLQGAILLSSEPLRIARLWPVLACVTSVSVGFSAFFTV